jgi:hypothetical protein
MDFSKQVARGILLLKSCGYDLDKIDLERLQLSNCRDCVLGQLCGSYSVGVFEFNIWREVDDRVSYGFTVETDSKGITNYGEFAALTVEWKKQLTALRQPKENQKEICHV